MQNRLSSTGVADCGGTVVWREDTCFVSCKRILPVGFSACDGSLWQYDSVFPTTIRYQQFIIEMRFTMGQYASRNDAQELALQQVYMEKAASYVAELKQHL